MEGEMNPSQILTISQVIDIKKLGISLKRVIIWTLIFTDVFFLSYFFAKLLH